MLSPVGAFSSQHRKSSLLFVIHVNMGVVSCVLRIWLHSGFSSRTASIGTQLAETYYYRGKSCATQQPLLLDRCLWLTVLLKAASRMQKRALLVRAADRQERHIALYHLRNVLLQLATGSRELPPTSYALEEALCHIYSRIFEGLLCVLYTFEGTITGLDFL